MNLTPGTRLGAYEIVDLVGSGGMGEVYRARDTRLDRTVAIKVLQGHLAVSPETRQRFDREARIVSSLNHPHICTLYDVGHQDGMDYLVMEFLEGESLAERLAKGPLPLPELLKIGMEIADALDRAHRQGLVHRDLKPGNIVLTKGGAKLLDFGLARATGLENAPRDLSSPTMSRPLTAEGTIVGTFQYMAPEQLEAAEADARSDIFSFGAVLYEMATGRRAFEGKSQASLIAAILREAPKPIASIRDVIPPAVERVILRCLEKNPDDRYQTARDVLLDLKWAAEAGSRAGVAAPVAARRKSRERLAWTLAGAGLAAALLLGGFTVMNRPPEPVPMRFFAPTPRGIVLNDTPKVSPDGRFIAYNAADSTGRSSIWLRPLNSLVAERLPGTESARRPFWSPDSRYLGFMQDGKLRKIAVQGGPAQTLCESQSQGDGSWSRGQILFDGSPTDSIRMVSAGGGTPRPATKIDRANGETGGAWPSFLPDGRHFLYLGLAATADKTVLHVGDIRSDKVVTLGRGAYSRIEYVAPGYILFARDRSLLAQPFDAGSLRFTGDPFPVVDDIAVGGGVGSNADFSSSATTLVFRGGSAIRNLQLLWVDRTGKTISTLGNPAEYFNVTLAPDGRRAVCSAANGDASDLWIVDGGRGVSTRFTFDPASDFTGVWSPDGTRIAFTSDRLSPTAIYVKRASGAGGDSLLFHLPQRAPVTDWSSDGRFLACAVRNSTTNFDVWIFPLDGSRKPYPLVASPATEFEGAISPDSRWMAYTSNESGRGEVYLQSIDGSGGKLQVSDQGGRDARWRRDGKEIYYLAPNGGLYAVDVQPGPTLALGTPHMLFRQALDFPDPTGHYYAVSPDGQRFLVRRDLDNSDAPVTTVYVNWLPKR